MKVQLANLVGNDYDAAALRRLARIIEDAFAKVRVDDSLVIGLGTKIVRHLSATANLNFTTPAFVPGLCVSNTITVTGAALGDTVVISASIATPAGFIPPIGWISAPNTVTLTWAQIGGAPADPDGAGAVYRADVWQH